MSDNNNIVYSLLYLTNLKSTTQKRVNEFQFGMAGLVDGGGGTEETLEKQLYIYIH